MVFSIIICVEIWGLDHEVKGFTKCFLPTLHCFCSNAFPEATPQKKVIEIDITNSDTIPGDVGSLGASQDKSPKSPIARPTGHGAKQTSPVASTASSLPSSYGSNASVCWRKVQNIFFQCIKL